MRRRLAVRLDFFARVALLLVLLFAALYAVHDSAAEGTSLSQDTVAVQPPLAPLRTATSTDESLNWSGYVAQSGYYTSVSGSWVVPQVEPERTLAADATWVGVGGVGTRSLIQAGTQAVVDASGMVEYEAWVEALPSDSVTVPLAVHAGDVISASVTEVHPGEWSLSIRNSTTGKTYQTTVVYDAPHTSVEWIQEMPSGNVFLPLDKFGSVTFFDASAQQDGTEVTPAAAAARPLTMVSARGTPLARPSILGRDGKAFTVTREQWQARPPVRPD